LIDLLEVEAERWPDAFTGKKKTRRGFYGQA